MWDVVTALCHAYGYWIFDVPELKLTSDGDYPPRADVSPEFWIRRPDGIPLRQPSYGIIVSGLALPRGIGRIVYPEFEQWLPSAVFNAIKPRRGPLGTPVQITHPNGLWTIDFGSSEQGSTQFEGTKYDWAGFDEPPNRQVFLSVWRGLVDFFSPFWMTYTPLGVEAQWLYEEFYTKERDDVSIIEVRQSDNPYVSREALDAFEAGVEFTEEELLARREGRFGFLSYRAFPTFDPDVHVCKPFKIPREWPKVCACDPANRRPFYFLWLAYDPNADIWYAYREFPREKRHDQYRSTEWSIKDYVTFIRNDEGEERVDARVVDPRFGPAEMRAKGQRLTSVVEDFARFGMHFDSRIPDTQRIETGVERIRELLAYDRRRPIDYANTPRLFLFEHLKSLRFAMENWSFVPPSQRDSRELADKLQEAFKDPVDALRYAILNGPPINLSKRGSGYISQEDLEEHNSIPMGWL